MKSRQTCNEIVSFFQYCRAHMKSRNGLQRNDERKVKETTANSIGKEEKNEEMHVVERRRHNFRYRSRCPRRVRLEGSISTKLSAKVNYFLTLTNIIYNTSV